MKTIPTQLEWVVFSASSAASGRAHLSVLIIEVLLFLFSQENNQGQESTVFMGFSLNFTNKIGL